MVFDCPTSPGWQRVDIFRTKAIISRASSWERQRVQEAEEWGRDVGSALRRLGQHVFQRQWAREMRAGLIVGVVGSLCLVAFLEATDVDLPPFESAFDSLAGKFTLGFDDRGVPYIAFDSDAPTSGGQARAGGNPSKVLLFPLTDIFTPTGVGLPPGTNPPPITGPEPSPAPSPAPSPSPSPGPSPAPSPSPSPSPTQEPSPEPPSETSPDPSPEPSPEPTPEPEPSPEPSAEPSPDPGHGPPPRPTPSAEPSPTGPTGPSQ
jgi:hypothetical protein